MGWWNEQIYGGDPAIEWKENIYELCEADEYGKDMKPQPIPREVLSEKSKDIIKMIRTSDTNNEDKNVGYQVLGAIMMHAGFDIDSADGFREKLLNAINNDAWADNNPVRRNVMQNYKKLVNEYDFSEPVDVDSINMLEESEDDEEEIAKEFKQVFSLISGRKKKLKESIEEKSGNEDYDEGFEVAASEEIDFLTEFTELLSRQETLGILLERISKGLIDSNPLSEGSEPIAKTNGNISEKLSSGKLSSGGNDLMPG